MALSAEAGSTPVKDFGPRLLVLSWLVAVAFLVLAGRLYVLQIVRGEELSSQGQRNFLQRVRIPHDRGIIYDRFGRILVDNRPSLDVQVTPAFLGKGAAARGTLERLAMHLGLTHEELAKVEGQALRRSRLAQFQPVVVKRDVSPAEVEAIEADRSVFLLDGVDIIEGRRRSYPYGMLAAHLLGYVNEIDAAELEAERRRGNPEAYELGDLVGRDGVERMHEADLRGRDGYEEIVVDAKGRRQHHSLFARMLGEQHSAEPTPGKNLYLTIDLDLQRVAEAALKHHGQAGAVVVADVRNGALLALVSVPEFDPNVASGALGASEKALLDTDALTPWLNRPIQGTYAPGSTFKVITAAAALMEKVTHAEERVFCPGHFRMGSHVWRCHKDSGHGWVDLKDAIKFSCDTYFYTMASRMGIDPIAKVARLFGFGAPSGIALRNERGGIAPDEAYHNRVEKASGGYQKGMAINTAIGQGALTVTPIQLAYSYAAIANGGTIWTPTLIQRIEYADLRVARRYFTLPPGADLDFGATPLVVFERTEGEAPSVVRGFSESARRAVQLEPRFWTFIREGLVAVSNEAGGTAYSKRSQKITMAGKTGTAQVVRLGRDRLKPEEVDYFHRDHAWFVAYAPAEEPEIAIAVLNEHSGHGGSHAAPVAKEVLEAYADLRARHASSAQAASPEPGGQP